MSAAASGKRLELVRGLGPWASAAIVVGTMIGTGIFLKPAEMAREGRFVSVVFAAWIVGAIFSMFGALRLPNWRGHSRSRWRICICAAVLGRSGDFYLMDAPIVGRPSSMASIAAGIARFASFLIPAVAAPLFTLHLPAFAGMKPYDFVFTWAQPVAVLWLIIMTLVNYLGVRLGGAVQVVLTLVKIASVLVVIGVAFFSVGSPPHPPDRSGLHRQWDHGIFAAPPQPCGWRRLGGFGPAVPSEELQKNFPCSLGGVFAGRDCLLALCAHGSSVLPFGNGQ
jgi:L-asparagine transporter-like permease